MVLPICWCWYMSARLLGRHRGGSVEVGCTRPLQIRPAWQPTPPPRTHLAWPWYFPPLGLSGGDRLLPTSTRGDPRSSVVPFSGACRVRQNQQNGTTAVGAPLEFEVAERVPRPSCACSPGVRQHLRRRLFIQLRMSSSAPAFRFLLGRRPPGVREVAVKHNAGLATQLLVGSGPQWALTQDQPQLYAKRGCI